MEYFWGSVKLMLLVYALAAVVSFLVAWLIRIIFAVIKMRRGRADPKAPLAPAAAAPEAQA